MKNTNNFHKLKLKNPELKIQNPLQIQKNEKKLSPAASPFPNIQTHIGHINVRFIILNLRHTLRKLKHQVLLF